MKPSSTSSDLASVAMEKTTPQSQERSEDKVKVQQMQGEELVSGASVEEVTELKVRIRLLCVAFVSMCLATVLWELYKW